MLAVLECVIFLALLIQGAVEDFKILSFPLFPFEKKKSHYTGSLTISLV